MEKEKPHYKILNREEIKNFDDSLISFAEQIERTTKRIKEIDGEEIIFLKDESRGLCCECHSRRLNTNKLLSTAQAGFKFLEERREKNKLKLPVGVG